MARVTNGLIARIGTTDGKCTVRKCLWIYNAAFLLTNLDVLLYATGNGMLSTAISILSS